MIQRPHYHCPRRPGIVLIMVLIVIAMLSLAGFTFNELMFSEHKASHLANRQIQARALAESGVEMAKQFLAQDADAQTQAGGWYNNPGCFRGVVVADDASSQNQGRFTFIAPNFIGGVPAGTRYGLENESTRLNLNILLAADQATQNGGRTMLMNLPGMTEDIADAIMDWIDSDDDTREFGAESDYYMALDPGYAPANAIPQTLEELLLVEGVTPSLLFGGDANRNHVLDPNESDSSTATQGSTLSDGEASLGWANYLTLYSAESNLKADGTAKIYLNQSDMSQLSNQLQTVFSPDWVTFIVAYRQNGAYTAPTTTPAPAPPAKTSRFFPPGRQRIDQRLLAGTNSAWQSFSAGQLPWNWSAIFFSQLGSPGSAGTLGGASGAGTLGGASGAGTLGGASGVGGLGGASGAGGLGGASGSGSNASSSTTGPATGQLDLTQPGKTQIKTILDLVGVSVQVTFQGQSKASILTSPFSSDSGAMSTYLPQLMENVTVYSGNSIPGRININQAPQTVLSAIPGMTDDIIQGIMGQRQEDPDDMPGEQQYETWPLTEGVCTLAQMKALLPYVTTGGSVYRGQVVGFFDGGGPAVRIEVVLDATASPPHVLFWREISQLGRGFSLDDLGAESSSQ